MDFPLSQLAILAVGGLVLALIGLGIGRLAWLFFAGLTKKPHVSSQSSGDMNVSADLSTSQNLIEDLRNRVAQLQAVDLSMQQLSTQVNQLERTLANGQARGAFGEVQLEDLLRDLLPAHMLSFQHGLSNGKRVDCLLKLPGPPGNLPIDAKFPLTAYQEMEQARNTAARKAARQKFVKHLNGHLKDIHDKYRVPGETSNQALMFLPSEALFSRLHSDFPELVGLSHQLRVWIVSPSTLAALVTTLRAAVRDSLLSSNLQGLQGEIDGLLTDLQQLEETLTKADQRFEHLGRDLETLHRLRRNLARRGSRVQDARIGPEKTH